MPRGLILIASERLPKDIEAIICDAKTDPAFIRDCRCVIEGYCACFGQSDYAVRVFAFSSEALLQASATLRERIQGESGAYVHTSTIAGAAHRELEHWRRTRRTVMSPVGDDDSMLSIVRESCRDLADQMSRTIAGMIPRLGDDSVAKQFEVLYGKVAALKESLD